MEPEINDDEVLSDSASDVTTTRPSTADSLDMPKMNIQSARDSYPQRHSSSMDFIDILSSSPPIKQLKEEKPPKVLIFNGKCSKIFKSTLEECVEDCILEFPGENNSIYVPKSGQSIQIPPGSNRNSITSLREQSAGGGRLSARSNRRQTPTNQHNSLPQIGGNTRNNFSLPTTALAATTAARMRQQLIQQRFPIVEDISEESIEQQTIIEQPQITTNIESEEESKRHSILPDESISPNVNITSASLPIFRSSKISMSYRDRQKDYRLSDLVMFGPEYYAHVFNLPRHQSSSRQRNRKTTENLTELDRIKQDLFHRYLWTQKPQVSCRIRPISSYCRSSTFVN